MSFAPETEKLVNELIQAEYLNAVVNYGEKFNSLHEGYAVLLEEVEEVDFALRNVKIDIDLIWTLIKNDCLSDRKLNRAISSAKETISELAQVVAVLMKIKNTLEGDNKCKDVQ